MTQQQAIEVKDLAKPTVEAVALIAKRKCPECKGKGAVFGWIDFPSDPHPNCSNCNGTGKVKWKWEPKWNDLAYLSGTLVSIRKWWILPSQEIMCMVDRPEICGDGIVIPQKDLIPILHWEEIERVLEGVGYWVKVDPYGGNRAMIGSLPKHYQVENWVNGKCRQEAVMKAVIKLGEKINEDK